MGREKVIDRFGKVWRLAQEPTNEGKAARAAIDRMEARYPGISKAWEDHQERKSRARAGAQSRRAEGSAPSASPRTSFLDRMFGRADDWLTQALEQALEDAAESLDDLLDGWVRGDRVDDLDVAEDLGEAVHEEAALFVEIDEEDEDEEDVAVITLELPVSVLLAEQSRVFRNLRKAVVDALSEYDDTEADDDGE